jgi:hypothetical protein
VVNVRLNLGKTGNEALRNRHAGQSVNIILRPLGQYPTQRGILTLCMACTCRVQREEPGYSTR